MDKLSHAPSAGCRGSATVQAGGFSRCEPKGSPRSSRVKWLQSRETYGSSSEWLTQVSMYARDTAVPRRHKRSQDICPFTDNARSINKQCGRALQVVDTRSGCKTLGAVESVEPSEQRLVTRPAAQSKRLGLNPGTLSKAVLGDHYASTAKAGSRGQTQRIEAKAAIGRILYLDHTRRSNDTASGSSWFPDIIHSGSMSLGCGLGGRPSHHHSTRTMISAREPDSAALQGTNSVTLSNVFSNETSQVGWILIERGVWPKNLKSRIAYMIMRSGDVRA